jgi:hypothetical protein
MASTLAHLPDCTHVHDVALGLQHEVLFGEVSSSTVSNRPCGDLQEAC